MKLTHIIFCIALLGPGYASAQTTDYSEPMGSLRVTLKGGSDTRIGQPFETKPLFQGRVESTSGNSVTLAGTPGWSSGQWTPADQATGDSYQLLIMTGTEEGMSLPVTSNTADTLTVDLGRESLDAVATDAEAGSGNGDYVRILPYTTPDRLFGEVDLPDLAIIYLYDQENPTVNRAPLRVLTYYDADDTWYDKNFAQADHVAISRGETIVVRLPSGSDDIDVVLEGHVPMTADRKRIPAETSHRIDFPFTINDPTSVTLGNSGLDIVDGAILYAFNQSDADFNKAPISAFTYFEGYGWYDGDFNQVDDSFALEPDAGYILRVPKVAQGKDYIISRLPSYLSP